MSCDSRDTLRHAKRNLGYSKRGGTCRRKQLLELISVQNQTKATIDIRTILVHKVWSLEACNICYVGFRRHRICRSEVLCCATEVEHGDLGLGEIRGKIRRNAPFLMKPGVIRGLSRLPAARRIAICVGGYIFGLTTSPFYKPVLLPV